MCSVNPQCLYDKYSFLFVLFRRVYRKPPACASVLFVMS